MNFFEFQIYTSIQDFQTWQNLPFKLQDLKKLTFKQDFVKPNFNVSFDKTCFFKLDTALVIQISVFFINVQRQPWLE